MASKLADDYWQNKISLYYPILYTIMGLSVACGTEQGLAFILAYVIIKAIRYIRSKETTKKKIMMFFGELFGVAIVTYAVLSIMTLGHAHDALRYALIEVPKDQGWYFGTPPNSFLQLNTLDQLVTKRMLLYMLPVMIGGVVAYIISIRKKVLSKKRIFHLFYIIAVWNYSVRRLYNWLLGAWRATYTIRKSCRIYSCNGLNLRSG